jgi:hypothetical protein
MPMFDLGSEERDTDEIRWTAGGKSNVTVIVGGERVFRGDVQKGERIIIAYSDKAENTEND